jgi:ribose transport system substrate-binding protein
MKTLTKHIVVASLYAASLACGAAKAAETIKIGVSVPSADHGWTGGIDFFAQEAKNRLESLYKNVQVIVKTATGPSDQANSLEDLVATQQINALVILPYESAPLTDPFVRSKRKVSLSRLSIEHSLITRFRISMWPATIRAWAKLPPNT